jgi:tRNA (guanosine-2'-O-)-methyltransferase
LKSEKRIKKLQSVAERRQPGLQVVIENIHDRHNVSAIFRTCDAVGVPKVSLIYNEEKFPKIGKKSSASAFKWVDKERYRSVDDCYRALRQQGFTILASTLADDAKVLYTFDLTQKVAVVMGNEHRGVSEQAAEKADARYFIPMLGMVQSLNVSVATAVTLYEILRQRLEKGMYDEPQYSPDELEAVMQAWIKK